MQAKKTTIGLVVSCLVTALSGLYSFNANAAGFALIENGAGGLGNAYAGASAVAEDASTIYFNPAGLSKLKDNQLIVAAHYIGTTADFTDSGSSRIATFGGTALTGTNADGGTSSLIPSFFYSNEINDKWSFGLGVTVPFGLGTEYDENWIGRYQAIKSEIHTININPSASFKINEKIAIGFGVSAQFIEASLSNRLDSAAYCLGALVPVSGGALTAAECAGYGVATVSNAATDSFQSLSGEDWSLGWNLGLLYDVSETSRLGLSYRSGFEHKLTGSVDFTVNSGLQNALTNELGSTLLSDTTVSAGIDLPESISISFSHDLNPKWLLLFDATWTKWEVYDQIVIKYDNPAQSDTTLVQAYQNNWRYSVGASYKPDEKRIYRMGLALDETAVRNAQTRTARSPGNDRLWLSLGFGYDVTNDLSVDVGYTHLFIDNTPIDHSHALWGTVEGSYAQSVDIISAQLTWGF